eukprot:Nk52_evm10s2256 gene=Nk52_evmTU10s2256
MEMEIFYSSFCPYSEAVYKSEVPTLLEFQDNEVSKVVVGFDAISRVLNPGEPRANNEDDNNTTLEEQYALQDVPIVNESDLVPKEDMAKELARKEKEREQDLSYMPPPTNSYDRRIC